MNMNHSQHQGWIHQDETKRRKWQDPEATLEKTGIVPGMTFMEIGCGNGFFTLPAARIAGKQGKVYALDADEKGIDMLKSKAHEEGLDNIITVVGRGEETVLCDACADTVFFGNVLHDFQDAALVLSNARKMVSVHGRLYNVDWKPMEMKFGPPLRIRFSPEYASELITKAGFRIERTEDVGKYHYLIEASPV
jgi:ubiquinone/menaquinone biosynthesis C-methylase UbiE